MFEAFVFWTVLMLLIGYSMGRAASKKAHDIPSPVAHSAKAGTDATWKTEISLDDVPSPVAPKPKQHLDNATVLLYFGAFLVIAGVGLFVGLSDFDGTVKTIAVALVALLFYGGGLYLYDKIDRLRPAAITLTAIGLVSMPLVGVALYAYVTEQSYGSTIWFVTSLISLAFYAGAIWKIRQSFMGYMGVFMMLSLWMSVVSVIDAPVHFFGWAAILLSMAYLLIAKRLKVWSELEAPLSISAALIVPITLLMMLLFAGEYNDVTLMHKGITALLATAFYAMATWLSTDTKEQVWYASLCSFLMLLATTLIAFDQTSNLLQTAYWLSGVSIAQIAMMALFKAQLPHDWRKYIGLVTAVGMFIAAMMAMADRLWVEACWLVVVQVLASAFAAFYLRDKIHLGLGLLGILALPIMVGFLAIVPPVERQVVVTAYFAIGLVLMFAGSYADKVVAGYRHTIMAAYAIAWGFAVLLGNLAGFLFWGPNADPQWLPVVTTLTGAVLSLVSAYFEGKPALLYIFALLGGIGVWQWIDLAGESNNYGLVLLVMCTMNLLAYGVGKLHQLNLKLSKFAKPWVWGSLAGLLLWSVQTMFTSYDALNAERWPSGIFMMVGGGLVAYESYKQHSRSAMYIGGGITLLGLQWMMSTQNIDNYLVYTHMWAAYFGLLAWLSARDGKPQDRQAFTVLALLIQTVPLAFEGLQGDTGYGLLLLFESVAITIAGSMIIHDRFVTFWGLAVAVASVLYQLRSYQFFVLALLGAGIIGLAVYMLWRKESHK